MLQSIVPPMVGATEMKSPPDRGVEKDFKGTGSGSSFGKALEEKITSKDPKETKEPPQRDMKAKNEKPEKTEAKKGKEPEVSQNDGKTERKGTVRQQKIKEFMDSFESEFEISPTRLVEAMSQLDDTQLVQSPEETAQAVISQLGLSDEDADKAQAMYAGLLLQLQQTPAPAKAPEFAVGAGVVTQAGVQLRAEQAQAKQNMLGNTVDRLNQKFWTDAQAKPLPSAALGQLDAAAMQNMDLDEASFADIPKQEIPMDMPLPEMPQQQAPKLPELPPHLQGQMKDTMSPALLAALAAKKATDAQAAQGTGVAAEAAVSEQGAELMAEFTQAVKTPEAPKIPTAQALNPLEVQAKLSQEFMRNESQGGNLMQQGNDFMKGMSAEKEMGEKSTLTSGEFKQGLEGLQNVHGAPIKGESLKMDAALPLAGTAPQAPVDAKENEAAVKQLMNQAQYLIKRGGGEMKVQMTPEGMGTIHLKVMLQDGKVNMQMSADTQEAKKAIESSLAELKTSLAAHKLSMENVKVDVVNSTSADTATQNQTNMNGNQQRDQARQFWNQFNENFGSQGRKESFADMPSLKGYGGRRDPLQPIETRSTPTRKVEGRGSGLNLVA
ncbi:flagellar hook-length control protein FliK [Bdellovibrio bacteriovorus]|uniref:flagellar hook-length control protein FliK n=1 Tax=Bdellovibrio bacteriovorus TaxID=959 RepID=UPI003CFF29FD